MKGAFSVEPPSTVPAESNRGAVSRLERNDLPVTSRAYLNHGRKSPTASVHRQNSQPRAKAEEDSAKPTNQALPAAPPP